jgi:hypothetical protein
VPIDAPNSPCDNLCAQKIPLRLILYHQFLTAPHFTIMMKHSMFATLLALKLLPILAALQLPFLESSGRPEDSYCGCLS